MDLDRRKLLAGMGAVALAGCSSQGTDDSGGGGDSSNNDQSGPTTAEFINDTRTVSEDGWYQWNWSQERTIEYDIQYTVRQGPEIDVFMMTEDEFENFDSGNRFRTISALSDSGTGGNLSGSLGSGTYYFVLDNSEAGPTAPPTNFDDDPAEVEIESTQTY